VQKLHDNYSESKGRFFLQNESIRITNRIANWNALAVSLLLSARRAGDIDRLVHGAVRIAAAAPQQQMWAVPR